MRSELGGESEEGSVGDGCRLVGISIYFIRMAMKKTEDTGVWNEVRYRVLFENSHAIHCTSMTLGVIFEIFVECVKGEVDIR